VKGETVKRFSILLLTCILGCQERQTTVEPMLGDNKSEYVVTLVVDMSGSFDQMMTEGGYAYQWALRLIDRYFKDRIGNADRLIISQISANETALLWEGSPHELRKTFGTPKAFAQFLRERSHPAGSSVHKAIADSIEYMIDRPHQRSALFVLSDMSDTGPADGREKAVDMLRKFGQQGGVVGLYYVAPPFVAGWKADLANAGVRESCVESIIVANPRFPSF
jgi:hypothetical protein